MGIIWSRGRKKKSAVETLEKLENNIKELEGNRSSMEKNYKKFTKLFLIYTFVLYVLCGIFLYFQFTATLQWKLLYLVPLASSPLLLYIIRRIISWYYIRMINKNQMRLNEMKKEKKKILDEVMDKETYKVAKEILEKYSEDRSDNLSKMSEKMMITSYRSFEDGLTKRNVSAKNSPRPLITNNPVRSFNTQHYSVSGPRPVPSKALQRPGTPVMRLPAPVLPLERSYMDKVVEYLIGDGPNNRYALICQQCHSHNGMALKEEFEYIGFKCCYCFFYNPARKVRPEAPKLETQLKDNCETDSDSDSKTSEENSGLKTALDNSQELEKNLGLTLLEKTDADIDSIIFKLNNLSNDSSKKENVEETNVAEEETPSEDAEQRNSDQQDDGSKYGEDDNDCDESVEKS